MSAVDLDMEKSLILTPRGRDAQVAASILSEAHIAADICATFAQFVEAIAAGAETAIITEEALRDVDTRPLARWVASQPAWSDLPFVVLTEHGGGIERNPAAAKLTEILGNVSFLERPFHPTTLVSLVLTNLRGRRRQYDCRRLNEELESRVQERTAELASANGQLLAQIEERERVETTLRQMQQLEAVGQLTAGVAHDFNNLLTVVLGNIAFLEKNFASKGIDPPMRQRVALMRAAAERGAKLTDQLLSFSRSKRLEPKILDLNHAVSGMHELLQSTMGGSIQIETNLSSNLWPAIVDPTQIELAVLNLAINARDAMGIGGALSVSTSNVTLNSPAAPEEPSAGDYVEICVTDTGSGMTEDVRAKALDPFFTTKDIGKGSGLGLSQVLGFAKQSGGGISISTSIGHGTSVRIYVPRSLESVDQKQETSGLTHLPETSEGRILLVDDDNSVREVTAAMLRESGFDVMEASSGGAAIEMIQHIQPIHLLVIDFAMPGMSGVEAAKLIRVRFPSLPILFITGFADRSLAGVADTDVVGKPFLNDEFVRKVRLAVAGEASRSRS